jgi:hypothetical protein
MMQEVKECNSIKEPESQKIEVGSLRVERVEPVEPVEQYAIVKCIQDKINDQDFMQKVGMTPVVALEMYRVIVSSFLVLFVPQKCDDHVCTLSENMVLENDLYNAGLVFNFLTMAAFLAMYTFEVKRENRLITYLEVNKTVASDNNSVGLVLNKLPVDKRDSIWELDKYYIYSGWTAIIMFIINTILSGFVVYEYYLDSQTTSTYITNILFMVTKLADVHSNVNTEKNVFYSAYLKGKIQYNDVDPDKAKALLLEDEKKDYFAVSGVSDPGVGVELTPGSEEKKGKEEQESGKIVVINHDISSNPSSSDNLQKMEKDDHV